LFGKSTDEDLRKLSGETLMEIFEGVPQGNVGADELSAFGGGAAGVVEADRHRIGVGRRLRH
jgi:hypothetical protein